MMAPGEHNELMCRMLRPILKVKDKESWYTKKECPSPRARGFSSGPRNITPLRTFSLSPCSSSTHRGPAVLFPLAQALTFPIGGTALFMILLTLAIGRNLSCSLKSGGQDPPNPHGALPQTPRGFALDPLRTCGPQTPCSRLNVPAGPSFSPLQSSCLDYQTIFS